MMSSSLLGGSLLTSASVRVMTNVSAARRREVTSTSSVSSNTTSSIASRLNPIQISNRRNLVSLVSSLNRSHSNGPVHRRSGLVQLEQDPDKSRLSRVQALVNFAQFRPFTRQIDPRELGSVSLLEIKKFLRQKVKNILCQTLSSF